MDGKMKKQLSACRNGKILIALLPLFTVAVWMSARWLEIRTQLHSLAVLKEIGGEICYVDNLPPCEGDIDEVAAELTSVECLLGIRSISHPYIVSCQFTKVKVSDSQICSISALKYPVGLNLTSASVTDTGLSYIGRNCSSLKGLCVGGNRITDSGIAKLTSLSNLDLLDIENAAITDKGLEPLLKLRKLRTLWLNNTSITDAGIKAIAENCPKLKSLRVANTKITDEGLLHLQRLTELADLSLDNDGITNAGANHLATFVSLTSLSLANAKVDASGIDSICRLRYLERLNISGIKLSHRSLKAIVAIHSLRELDIRGAGLDRAEIDKAVSDLPMLDVKRDAARPVTPPRKTDQTNQHLSPSSNAGPRLVSAIQNACSSNSFRINKL
jgi:hypothetical protein